MRNTAAIIIAAGKGTRMKSTTPKVLHPVCGKPMLFYPLEILKQLKINKTVTVVGHQAKTVIDAFPKSKTNFVIQDPQNGTGNAVMIGLKTLKGFKGDVLVLSGDVPLITAKTLKALFKIHKTKVHGKNPPLSFISVTHHNPKGYGRVVRDDDGNVIQIVEQKDLKGSEGKIKEINAGIYLFSSDFLNKNLKKLSTKNAQGEYYLTDLISLASSSHNYPQTLLHHDTGDVMGVNNRVELATANTIKRFRITKDLMLSGVTIMKPDTTFIDYGVTIGMDSTIYPNVHLEGNTKIGKNCIIEEGVKLTNVIVGNGSHIKSHSIIEDTKIGKDVQVGPFARIRPETVIQDGAKVGNFVEVKKTIIGKGSKAGHLTYLGDTIIGKNVNIGAGTITCNYDGVNKHITRIDDGAFIGSDSQLVAPVTVGKNAYVGSGSTITKDVPSGKLAVTRVPQKTLTLNSKKKKSNKK